MAKKRLKLLRSFEHREIGALRESLHKTELKLLNTKLELTQARRELVAARLLIAIQRVRDDPRIATSTSLDEEMGNYVYDIVRNRHVEMITYDVAKRAWDLTKEGN